MQRTSGGTRIRWQIVAVNVLLAALTVIVFTALIGYPVARFLAIGE